MNSDLQPETAEPIGLFNNENKKSPGRFPWGWMIVAIVCGLIACLVSAYFLAIYYGLLPQSALLSKVPSAGTPEEAAIAFEEKIPFIWDSANDPVVEETTSTYSVDNLQEEEVLWGWLWCSKSPEDLTNNWESLFFTYTIIGKDIPLANFTNEDFDSIIEIEALGIQDAKCRLNYGILSDFPPGDYHMEIVATFPGSINDGWDTYPSGHQIINIFNVHISE
jgi:hypothetical protein